MYGKTLPKLVEGSRSKGIVNEFSQKKIMLLKSGQKSLEIFFNTRSASDLIFN